MVKSEKQKKMMKVIYLRIFLVEHIARLDSTYPF